MIYVLIPIHNRIAATLECLACLAKQDYKDYKIVIIDDGSTDNSAARIKEQYPESIILSGDGNLWWTGAMALGVAHILTLASAEDDILSLNNDVTFNADYLTNLLQASNKYQRAVVGSLCLDNKDKTTILDSGIKLKWYKYVYSQLPLQIGKTETEQIDTISGRGVLIPVPVFKKIGNFSANYLKHYGADYEFGLRVKAAKIPLIVSYKAIVYLKDELTGFRPSAAVLNFKDYYKKLFSIKSPNNIFVHLKIILRHAPNLRIKIFDCGYLILGNLYLFIKNSISYLLYGTGTTN